MISDLLNVSLFVLGSILISAALWDLIRDRQRRRLVINRLRAGRGREFSSRHDLAIADHDVMQRVRRRTLQSVEWFFGDLTSDLNLMRELGWLRNAIVVSSALGICTAISIYILFHLIGSGLTLGCFVMIGSIQVYSRIRIRRHTDAVTNALPQAVDGLIRCLKAGFDLSRSLTIVSSEVAPELEREFGRLIRNRDLGQSIGDAMFHLADRLRNPETLFLATLIAIQERSGGPLIEALTSLSQILRDRERLRQKRMVASAEARMSALILGGLPVLISSLLFASNPSYRDTLLNSQSGRGFLALAGILLLSGSLTMYRMIRVDPT